MIRVEVSEASFDGAAALSHSLNLVVAQLPVLQGLHAQTVA